MGLLDQAVYTRSCPFGHGLLVQVEGLWAVTGVSQRPGATPPEQAMEEGLLQPNGRAFTLEVWRCPACRSLQMFDHQD